MKLRFVMNLVVALGLTGSLFAADPFAGTWKLNVAKSKFPGPNQALKEYTVTVEVAGDQVTTTEKGTAADGSPILMKYTVPTTGGAAQFLEGARPGVSLVFVKSKADSSISDFRDTKDGKVISTGHAVVSADGKSFRATVKGTDAQGKKFERVEVFDKQ
jgi:hypothetical protein